MAVDEIVIVRLGAMGDILHALPALASLKASFPRARVRWVTAAPWLPLLEGNPQLEEVVPFQRGNAGELYRSWRELRRLKPDVAFDFQGLVQSALVGRATSPKVFWGWDGAMARESAAAWFYTRRFHAVGPHRVEANLQLIQAAGATTLVYEAWIPEGRREGTLPLGPFVLASPFAGWAAKQWPLSSYVRLAAMLQSQGISMVMNVAPSQAAALESFPNLISHPSSLAGLIFATRRAAAVVGVDSGPLHLAAALRKPGVAIYGPTNPTTHGPFGGSFTTLRAPDARTTYKRLPQIESSMRQISPEAVFNALMPVLQAVTHR